MNLSPEMSLVLPQLNRIEAGNSRQISPWMTTAEAADYLRCSTRQIEKLTRLGLLPFRRLDPAATKSQRLFHRRDLTAYLVAGRNPVEHRLSPQEKRLVEELL